MLKYRNIVGQKFGRLTALKYCESVPRYGAQWLWQCDCGGQKIAVAAKVKAGQVLSCGCLKQTHGLSKIPEYFAWKTLRARCFNTKSTSFKNYGGRGVIVCDRWNYGEGGLSGFECFIKDMGRRPSPEHSIERVDVDGNYCLENCIWATDEVQSRNKRNNVMVSYKGETMIISDAIRAGGNNPISTVYSRLERGWSLDDAIETPSRKTNK